MKIKKYNGRMRCGREGIEFYILPTIQVVLNEYGDKWQPNWSIKIWLWWFHIDFVSSKKGRSWK